MRGSLWPDRGGGATRGGDERRGDGGESGGGGGGGGGRGAGRSDRPRYADEPPLSSYFYESHAERGLTDFSGMTPRAHASPRTNADWLYSAERADYPLVAGRSSVIAQSQYASSGGGDLLGGLRGVPRGRRRAADLPGDYSALGDGDAAGGAGRGGERLCGSCSPERGPRVFASRDDDERRRAAAATATGSALVVPGRAHAARRPLHAVYLTESNRQDIMERIRRGEKQADLAKEHNVSRAAITNLKQRRQMLEMLENSSSAKDREEALKRRRLSHGNPPGGGGGGAPCDADGLADGRDPRALRRAQLRAARARSGSDDNGSEDSGGGSSTASSARNTRRGSRLLAERGGREEGKTRLIPTATEAIVPRGSDSRPAGHRELSTQTTSRLLATLLAPTTPDGAFRAAVARHTRLLLEEAIGWSFSRAPERYEPFALAFGGDEAGVLLAEYHELEPTGASASLRRAEQREAGGEIEIVARVPAAALRHASVFVLLDDLVFDAAEPWSPAQASAHTSGDRGGAADNGGATATTSSTAPFAATTDTATATTTTRQVLFLLHALVFSGLAESQIVVVVALCDERAAREIGQRFPEMPLVAASFLPAKAQAPALERQRVAAYRARRRALAFSPPARTQA